MCVRLAKSGWSAVHWTEINADLAGYIGAALGRDIRVSVPGLFSLCFCLHPLHDSRTYVSVEPVSIIQVFFSVVSVERTE